MQYILNLFGDEGLAPHGFCLLWQPGLVALHVVSDAVIGASYFAIPIALAYFVRRRDDVVFGWIFWMFGFFILACGTTHFFEIWVLWHPDYAAQGLVKALTAVASVATAVAIWPLLPQALALPSTAQFRKVNEKLSAEIAERNSALEKLQQSEERYRLLIEGVRDYAIYMLDTEGNVASWNIAAERMTGYAAEEVIGRHFPQFYSPDDQQPNRIERILNTVATEGSSRYEGPRLRKDGTRFWVSESLEPVRDRAGSLIGFAQISRDITEQRNAAEALERTRAALAQSQKMDSIGQLTGGIAHDFNNLLAAIVGNLALLRKRSDASVHHLIEGAMLGAQRGSTLTKRLLAFARRQDLKPTIVDVEALVRGELDLLKRSVGPQVELSVDVPKGLWLAKVDTNQLELALLNLALNARDAMPDGGQIAIYASNEQVSAKPATDLKPGDYIRICVKDTGIGMTQEVLSRAIEPFFTTKGTGKGTGLGLSMVHGLASQSGGELRLTSAPGQGTIAELWLPRAAEDVNSVAGSSLADSSSGLFSSDHSSPSRPINVLFVDDDVLVATSGAEMLRDLGHKVMVARSGKEALEIVGKHGEPELLITDQAMPGMTGVQLAAELLSRVPDIRVIVATGYADLPNSNCEFTLLNKPYSQEELAGAIANAMSFH